MLIINTGEGKGKTTAAMGQIMRSLGRGWKVCLIQLFKGKEFYGEQKVFKKLKNLDFHSFAPKHPYCFPTVKPEKVREECLKALSFLDRLVSGKHRYNLIVLEEFNIALREGYIKLKELLEVLNKIDSKTYVIITGRGAPKKLIDLADLVTEMKEIKHPYRKGIQAKRGLEY